MNRITYDLLDRSSVDELPKNSPIIDHQTFHPSSPRYIQSVYGIGVGILGLQDVWNAMPEWATYIRGSELPTATL